MDSQQLYKRLIKRYKPRGCTIDEDALHLFLSRMPNDLLQISKESK